MRNPLTILLGENNADDAFLLKMAFAEAGPNADVRFVGDGNQAMDYLRGVPPFNQRAEHPVPNVLVLDLKMPGMDGFEVLRWLQQQPASDRITAVVFSGTCCQADTDRALALGAKLCLEKPLDFRQLVEFAKGILEQDLARTDSAAAA